MKFTTHTKREKAIEYLISLNSIEKLKEYTGNGIDSKDIKEVAGYILAVTTSSVTWMKKEISTWLTPRSVSVTNVAQYCTKVTASTTDTNTFAPTLACIKIIRKKNIRQCMTVATEIPILPLG